MFLHVLRVIFILLEVVVLFNLLIVVHELGHFLAARWRGLVIEKFGVWFGKPLWKKTINGVQYSLGSLPFGGFVALPQLAPMDIIEGESRDRSRASCRRFPRSTRSSSRSRVRFSVCSSRLFLPARLGGRSSGGRSGHDDDDRLRRARFARRRKPVCKPATRFSKWMANR